MKNLYIFRHKKLFGRQAIYAWLILNISVICYVLLALLFSRYIKAQESIITFAFLIILPVVMLAHIYGYKNHYQIVPWRVRNHFTSTASSDVQKDEFDVDKTEQKLVTQQRQASSNSNNKNNAWGAGSFFLLVLVVVVATLVITSNYTQWYVLPLVLIAALLAIPLIDVLQALNDGTLTEKGFLKVVLESYQRLPLLRGKS